MFTESMIRFIKAMKFNQKIVFNDINVKQSNNKLHKWMKPHAL